MISKIALTILCLISTITLSLSQEYIQLAHGLSWKYKLQNGYLSIEVLKGKFKFENHEYFGLTRTYSWGLRDTLYSRIDSVGNQVDFNPTTRQEHLSVPKNFSLNDTWTTDDGSWQHQIYSTHERLVTPSKTFEDCLVIQAIDLRKKKRSLYLHYFVRGVGFVGSKKSQELTLYLIDYTQNNN
ncbi:hypothetical protein E1176_19770 [Fulvivirga sp. RKSG066]|uniref:hypothetical protein n=1 Tax=Fulvivirga aurantia TaxID=2529383 RepID=UPI0012BB846B|nr:hypothetical protein [Fulvivirga aurantia]MTI23277.1 hypothetical protein [Fulvivirga aurantia]